MLELVDGVLEFLGEHEEVGDDDDGIEEFLVLVIVQRGEVMREPCDGTLAAAGGVLDEVLIAGAVGVGVGDEFTNCIDLMEARKDEEFLRTFMPF